MKDYVIFTDATADIPAQLLEECSIEYLPMDYTINGQVITCPGGACSMNDYNFYNRLRQGEAATTSQISPETYSRYFTPVLKQGKDILYLCFSSGLSGSIQSANIAKTDLAEQFASANITIVDSLAATCGEGLLVLSAAKNKKDGLSLQENEQWLLKNRSRVCHWFTVDDLMFLKRGGRIPATTALLGAALQIKPVMHVDETGHLVNVSKVRGRRSSLDALVQKFAQGATNPAAQVPLISHGDCL